MYDKNTYAEVSDIYLSRTRCAKIKKPVKDDEEPVAFYRVDRGYCGLYQRKNEKEVIHSGNIEHYGKYTEDEAAAQAVADKLNNENETEREA